ncbi:unnamed protein product [Rotaria sordida]|uniref:Fibronectin type III-like domain-containing protein n=1 Tax=Rotaria sordida TaxID=392033 RepID=A0A814IJN9_9BILA|nr:unnamed protein product [Rotaria sordida]
MRLLMFLTFIISVRGQKGNFPDCKSGPLATFPICDQSLSSRQRAADLVSRMTIAEKITQMVTTAAAIPRLGLPKYEWWSEALHGIAFSPGVSFGGDLPFATSFAAPLNLGASFNMHLVYRMGTVISTEARAFNNEGRAGLTFFTPMLNIFRDPRWGRGQETPVNGLQTGEDDRYLKIATNCKAYNAYDLEEWNGTDRFHFDARINDQDLVETYLPPFETCIRDARAASIMCSYNSINGVPACANQFLIETLARRSYHLDGFVVSDCGAIATIMYTHNYTRTVQDTVAVALHAGTDLNCGDFYRQHVQEALNNKTIIESDIDQALERIFHVLVRLGYFDPPEQQIYRQFNKDNVNTVEAQQFALETAQEGIVLLKNLNNALPLNFDQLQNKKIALIGPTANATVLMQSNYYGQAPYLIDPITGFKSVIGGLINTVILSIVRFMLFFAGRSIDVEFAYGCAISGTDESGFAAAIQLARQSDIVIFFGGLDQATAAEGHDRTSITLPDIQLNLLRQLEQVVHSPIHVVMMCGNSLDLSHIRDSDTYGSLIWMGYAGQAGGLAIAKIIFGQYNPAGRLPMTIYPASYVDLVSMFDMQMRPSPVNPGRTYKFYTGQAIYEFGTGLSYSTFVYSWSNHTMISSYSIQSLIKDNHDEKRIVTKDLRVNVSNTGPIAGDDVVLAFVAPPQTPRNGQTPPIKQLFGFERVHLNVNETIQVFFPFSVSALLTVASNGLKWLHPGQYRILIGQQVIHIIELQGKSARWP